MVIQRVTTIPLLQGDTTELYEGFDPLYFRYFKFPHFPSVVVAHPGTPEENEALYRYQQQVWKRLGWYGSASRHQTHYIWCLNRMLQCGTTMTVRRYARGIDYTGGQRVGILSIRESAANSSSIHFVDPDTGAPRELSRTAGLDPQDFRLVLGEGNDQDDAILGDKWTRIDRQSNER